MHGKAHLLEKPSDWLYYLVRRSGIETGSHYTAIASLELSRLSSNSQTPSASLPECWDEVSLSTPSFCFLFSLALFVCFVFMHMNVLPAYIQVHHTEARRGR